MNEFFLILAIVAGVNYCSENCMIDIVFILINNNKLLLSAFSFLKKVKADI